MKNEINLYRKSQSEKREGYNLLKNLVLVGGITCPLNKDTHQDKVMIIPLLIDN